MVNNTVIQPWFRACKPVVIFCFSIGFIIGGVVSVFLVNALLDSQISNQFGKLDKLINSSQISYNTHYSIHYLNLNYSICYNLMMHLQQDL